jgi:hypothetical protein
MMPFATVALLPEPFAPRTFTGISEHVQQSPAWPSRLFVRAAATPAAAVPCPWSSLGSASFPTKS